MVPAIIYHCNAMPVTSLKNRTDASPNRTGKGVKRSECPLST